MAQQQREAQEKEKAEKYKKLFLVSSRKLAQTSNMLLSTAFPQEKEQRIKETQQKKLQEEMQRIQEQKRKEAEREQTRK